MTDELIPVGQSGNFKRLRDMGDGSHADVVAIDSLTIFSTRTAEAKDADGENWVDLLDMSELVTTEEIRAITLTVAGSWSGNAKFRIVDSGDNKIFPYGTELIEGTDWDSGVELVLPAPVLVPVSVGYKIQFRSSDGGDGEGETCALTELKVIQRG